MGAFFGGTAVIEAEAEVDIGDGSSSPAPAPAPAHHGLDTTTELLGAAVLIGLLVLGIAACLCRRWCRKPTPQPGSRQLQSGYQPPEPPPPPRLPAGMVLAASVPKVVSQTYLCFSVCGGSRGSPEAVRWTVQKRCSQFEQLAFSGALQARAVADPALASLTWPPRGRAEDPQLMEMRRAYADRWAQHLGCEGGLAWNTQVFRDFVALDEHIHQLQGVVDESGGDGGGSGGAAHQQYATDSGLFDAGLQQKLLGGDEQGKTRRV